MPELQEPRDVGTLVLTDDRGTLGVYQKKRDGMWGPLNQVAGSVNWAFLINTSDVVLLLDPLDATPRVPRTRSQPGRCGLPSIMTVGLAETTIAAIGACLKAVDVLGQDRVALEDALAVMSQWDDSWEKDGQ